MKFIFRNQIVFEYFPEETRYVNRVKQHSIDGRIAAFDHCRMIPDDYKLLSMFFDTVHRHTQGEDVDLKDFEV
jgi:hypothetical protein